MAESIELTLALAWHPEGPAHREHGSTTADVAGRPARREESRAGRWDYTAPSLQAWCGCGWFGPLHPQQRVPGRHEEWRRAHRSELAAIQGEWEDHVRETLPTLGIYEARARLDAAEAALTEAVGDARRRGVSWEGVGSATTLGKKTAHQRWGGNKDVLLDRQMSKGGRPRKPRPEPDPTTDDATATASTTASTTAATETTPAPASTSAGAGGRTGPENGAQADAGRRGRSGRSGRGRDTGRQVRELVRVLSQRHGLRIEASWEGTRSRDGRRGGWSIQCWGGPTRADLRADAALAVEEDPRLAGLDVRELSWFVGRTDADHAALVLEWLRTHPGEGERVRSLDESALPGWPEHLPAELRAHAATLAAAGWGCQRGGTAADTLHQHAARGGYDAVAAWLTELAAQRDAHRDAVQDGTVVDLATHRTH